MISSSVTGNVVGFPCTTIPRLSPTRIASTPAASSSPAHKKSYAVNTDNFRPDRLASTNRGTVMGRISDEPDSAIGRADMKRLSAENVLKINTFRHSLCHLDTQSGKAGCCISATSAPAACGQIESCPAVRDKIRAAWMLRKFQCLNTLAGAALRIMNTLAPDLYGTR